MPAASVLATTKAALCAGDRAKRADALGCIQTGHKYAYLGHTAGISGAASHDATLHNVTSPCYQDSDTHPKTGHRVRARLLLW